MKTTHINKRDGDIYKRGAKFHQIDIPALTILRDSIPFPLKMKKVYCHLYTELYTFFSLKTQFYSLLTILPNHKMQV